jgi:hypothetical protein
MSTDLGLDSCKVTLHGAEASLQGHDTCKVVAKLISALNELSFLVNPALKNIGMKTVSLCNIKFLFYFFFFLNVLIFCSFCPMTRPVK